MEAAEPDLSFVAFLLCANMKTSVSFEKPTDDTMPMTTEKNTNST